jgi:hypothetical protein
MRAIVGCWASGNGSRGRKPPEAAEF